MKLRISVLLGFLLILFSAQSAHAVPATEAEILALESNGDLLPDPVLVAQIDADLQLIRDAIPILRQITAVAPWVPGEILLGLTPDAYERFRAGEHETLQALNEQYGLLEVHWWDALNACHLTFGQPYHPVALSIEYAAIEGVRYVEPNYMMGDGPDIRRHVTGEYTFRYAWGDCPSGCLQEHIWRVSVECGFCRLRDELGDELPASLPAGECGIGLLKATFRAVD